MVDNGTFGFRDPLVHRFWAVVPPRYRQLLLLPPNICAHASGVDALALTLRAGVFGLGINAGLAARYDVRRAREYCEDLQQGIEQGRWSDDALYIVRPDLLAAMKARAGEVLACTVVDGFGACVTAASLARWSDALDIVRGRVPAIEEVVRFHEELNRFYRDVLSRAEQPREGSLERRLEGLMLYLAHRLEGCDAAEAEQRSLARLTGSASRELCSTPSVNQTLPPADQTFAYARRLAAALGAAPAAGSHPSAVDAEGEAVWIQAYTKERLRGVGESEARKAVLAQIRAVPR
jgi:hypothetical protein